VPDITFPAVDLSKAAVDLNNALKEGAYVALGLGVIGFQRAQVRRVQLTKQIEAEFGPQLSDLSGAIEQQMGSVRTQLTELAKSLDERVEPVLRQIDEQIDRLEQHLPDRARTVVQTVRSAAAAPEQLLREAVGRA